MAKEFYTDNGIITNIEVVTSYINSRANAEYSQSEIEQIVSNPVELCYVTRSGEECDNADIASYQLLKLDLYDQEGYPIYISMYKQQSEWRGHFVGTYNRLVSKIRANAAERAITANDEPTYNEFMTTIIELYGRLLNKEYWKSDSADASDQYTRLISYLYAVFSKCVTCRYDKSRPLVVSEDGYKVCFNTKLIDEYGNFIYIACKEQEEDAEACKIYEPSIIVSKSDLMRCGFKPEFPSAVNFFSSIDDVVFKGSIDDFDLDDVRRLGHLAEDSRKARLPERYQNISNVDLASCVKYSVEMALKLMVTDYRHIVPMYNVRNDEIQFMMPLYLDRRYAETPEVVLIVSKDSRYGLFSVNTMITIDAAYVNSRTISASTANWLERGMMLHDNVIDEN